MEYESYIINNMSIDNNELINKTQINEEYGFTNEIPLNIFQTWHSKTLPPKMKENVRLLKINNPEFKHYLFDDDDCREFIKTYYNDAVVKAFDKLKPGAFKADLWRYCILYIFGGIYLDIKFNCANGFKLINLTDGEYYVKDYGDDLAVYNAFIVCKPKNYIMLACIKQIVKNVENEYYGDSSLVIYKNNEIILRSYPEYREERQLTELNEHYNILWNKKDIYN